MAPSFYVIAHDQRRDAAFNEHLAPLPDSSCARLRVPADAQSLTSAVANGVNVFVNTS